MLSFHVVQSVFPGGPKETQPAQQEGHGAALVPSASITSVFYFDIWEGFPESSSFCPRLAGSAGFMHFVNSTNSPWFGLVYRDFSDPESLTTSKGLARLCEHFTQQ